MKPLILLLSICVGGTLAFIYPTRLDRSRLLGQSRPFMIHKRTTVQRCGLLDRVRRIHDCIQCSVCFDNEYELYDCDRFIDTVCASCESGIKGETPRTPSFWKRCTKEEVDESDVIHLTPDGEADKSVVMKKLYGYLSHVMVSGEEDKFDASIFEEQEGKLQNVDDIEDDDDDEYDDLPSQEDDYDEDGNKIRREDDEEVLLEPVVVDEREDGDEERESQDLEIKARDEEEESDELFKDPTEFEINEIKKLENEEEDEDDEVNDAQIILPSKEAVKQAIDLSSEEVQISQVLEPSKEAEQREIDYEGLVQEELEVSPARQIGGKIILFSSEEDEEVRMIMPSREAIQRMMDLSAEQETLLFQKEERKIMEHERMLQAEYDEEDKRREEEKETRKVKEVDFTDEDEDDEESIEQKQKDRALELETDYDEDDEVAAAFYAELRRQRNLHYDTLFKPQSKELIIELPQDFDDDEEPSFIAGAGITYKRFTLGTPRRYAINFLKMVQRNKIVSFVACFIMLITICAINYYICGTRRRTKRVLEMNEEQERMMNEALIRLNQKDKIPEAAYV